VTMASVSRSLAIITGASRGFGRALAVKCSEIVRPLDVVLVGRSEQDLSHTQQLVIDKQEVRRGLKCLYMHAVMCFACLRRRQLWR
jgi:short-subunit dehydrogenase